MNVTKSGIQLGPVWLDPKKPVENAVVSHAHADHAAAQSDNIYCTTQTRTIVEKRYNHTNIKSHSFETPFNIGKYTITFYPAGHILGSAMVHITNDGHSWLYTGDFATHHNPTTKQAQPVQCDTLITETTFALPVFAWPEPHKEIQKIEAWHKRNKARNKASLCFCYSLGKAQRILSYLKNSSITPYCHHTVRDMNQCYEDAGVDLGDWNEISLKTDTIGTKFIVLPPQLQEIVTIQKASASHGFCSGWMQIRGNKAWRGYDAGFVLSDHADWNGLVSFVKECDPSKIVCVHGYEDAFTRYAEETIL